MKKLVRLLKKAGFKCEFVRKMPNGADLYRLENGMCITAKRSDYNLHCDEFAAINNNVLDAYNDRLHRHWVMHEETAEMFVLCLEECLNPTLGYTFA